MNHILVLSLTPLNRDPRVYRQIHFLKNLGYTVSSAGSAAAEIEDRFIDLLIDKKLFSSPKRLFQGGVFGFFSLLYRQVVIVLWYMLHLVLLQLRLYKAAYWADPVVAQAYGKLAAKVADCDLILANDIQTLPLALRLAGPTNCPVYVDAHEYEPLHFNTFKFNFFYKRYWYWVCKHYLPKAAYMTTVCQGIADEYRRNFSVDCGVLMNLPLYHQLEPSPVADHQIKIVHHGVASPGRHIENMIQLMDSLDQRFSLDLLLLQMDSAYGQKLKTLAKPNPRIRFLPTVPMQDLPKFGNQYDIGLFLLYPNTFNHKMVLPNKFFEFIQARLAVAVWPSQEMTRILDQYQNGIYSEDFDVESMARIMNNLTKDDIIRMKHQSRLAARELHAGKNQEELKRIVERLTSPCS